MSTDYSYDEQVRECSKLHILRAQLISLQGQFFPFFILTITALVTLPLSYTLIKPSKGTLPAFPPFSSPLKSCAG